MKSILSLLKALIFLFIKYISNPMPNSVYGPFGRF